MRVPDGTLEALKWFALFLMTIDHINTYLLDVRKPELFAAGRIAMPLFEFVMAYNCARAGALQSGVYRRTIRRLALFGLIATPFYIALSGPLGRWWPLNIMFTLLAGACMSYLIERGGIGNVAAALVLFMMAGAVVDYQWFGLAFYLAAWYYCKAPSAMRLLVWLATCASLYFVNHNGWALLALPLTFAARGADLKVPRMRYAFYVYYPLHLAVLLAIQCYVPESPFPSDRAEDCIICRKV